MAGQSAFAAVFSPRRAVLALAVKGLPGLAIDEQLGSFPTWTEASAFARRLNEGLGLSACEARQIVTDAILGADALGSPPDPPDDVTGAFLRAEELRHECASLLQKSAQLHQNLNVSLSRLELTLVSLELGVTLCKCVQTLPPTPDKLERLLQTARKALSSAAGARSRFPLAAAGLRDIDAGIERLQVALLEHTPKG